MKLNDNGWGMFYFLVLIGVLFFFLILIAMMANEYDNNIHSSRNYINTINKA